MAGHLATAGGIRGLGTHSAYDLARVVDNGNCLLQWHVGQKATGKVLYSRKLGFDLVFGEG